MGLRLAGVPHEHGGVSAALDLLVRSAVPESNFSPASNR
jgi:hypothetical protein